VDLITAETLSPIFSFISSALPLSDHAFDQVRAHAYHHVRHHAAKFQFNNFSCNRFRADSVMAKS